MTIIKRLEKKYEVKIMDDSFYHPLTGKYHKRYKVYSADGCLWENGLTLKGLRAECKTWNDALLKIKENVDNF